MFIGKQNMKRQNKTRRGFVRTNDEILYNSFTVSKPDLCKSKAVPGKVPVASNKTKVLKQNPVLQAGVSSNTNDQQAALCNPGGCDSVKILPKELYDAYDKIEALMLKFLFEEEESAPGLSRQNCYNIFTAKKTIDNIRIYDSNTKKQTRVIHASTQKQDDVKRSLTDTDSNLLRISDPNMIVERLRHIEHLLGPINKNNESEQYQRPKFKKDYKTIRKRTGFGSNSMLYELLEFSEPCIERESNNEYIYKTVATPVPSYELQKRKESECIAKIKIIKQVIDQEWDVKLRNSKIDEIR